MHRTIKNYDTMLSDENLFTGQRARKDEEGVEKRVSSLIETRNKIG